MDWTNSVAGFEPQSCPFKKRLGVTLDNVCTIKKKEEEFHQCDCRQVWLKLEEIT